LVASGGGATFAGDFQNFYTVQKASAGHGNSCREIAVCADLSADTKVRIATARIFSATITK